jgi:molecular chaperone Hsp33
MAAPHPKPDPVPEPDPDAADGGAVIEVTSSFVRGRNALAVRAGFAALYTDYYLHLMQHGLSPEPVHDDILKDALAAFTLYLTSRPWKEVTAWTTNLRDPLLNVFVTGSSLAGTVTGRVFTDGVRELDRGRLYSQVTLNGGSARQSFVEIDGNDFFSIAERFHRQSDQRPARFFRLGPEEFILLAAQPQCDAAWLENLDEDAARTLEEFEEVSLLETRVFRFGCGCDIDRVLPALAPLSASDLDDLFDGVDSLKVTCPRCAAVFLVRREQIEAFRADRGR